MNKANPFHTNENIVLHRVKAHSDEWYGLRPLTVGASEVSTIIGHNPYGNVWMLWEEKSGWRDKADNFQERMACGLILEDRIADMWKYWHPREEWYRDYLHWLEGGDHKPRRTCQRVKAVISNKKYPWLTTNLDRVADENQCRADFQVLSPRLFQVEIKNIDTYVASQYQDKIPAYYHAQAQAQMLITEVDYYEFAGFIGGNHLEVQGYYPDPKMQADILEQTHFFWHNNVLPAKELKEKADKSLAQGSFKSYEELRDQAYATAEPERKDVPQYYDYMKTRYKYEFQVDENHQMALGDPEILKKAKLHKIMTTIAGLIDKESERIKTNICGDLREQRIKYMAWEDGGKITWFPDKGKTTPTFRNYALKTKEVNIELLQKFINELNMEDYLL